MQVAIQACIATGTVGAIFVGILLSYHKDTLAVWTTFTAIVFFALSVCLFWQSKILERQEALKISETNKTRQTTGISVSGVGNIVRDNYVNGTDTGYDIKGNRNLAEKNVHIAPKK